MFFIIVIVIVTAIHVMVTAIYGMKLKFDLTDKGKSFRIKVFVPDGLLECFEVVYEGGFREALQFGVLIVELLL